MVKNTCYPTKSLTHNKHLSLLYFWGLHILQINWAFVNSFIGKLVTF